MMQQSPRDQILIRSTDMEIFFQGQETWLVNRHGRIRAGSSSLSLIDHLAKPNELGAVVEDIASRGARPEQTSHLKATLNREAKRLIAHRFLLAHADQKPSLQMKLGSFDAAESHVRMLNDYSRTAAFRKALMNNIGPDSVVLDIGTGTGVLAAFAAQAGAKRVYAIERSPVMASLARQFIDSNGLGARVMVVEGTSTSVKLPEKVDCIVGELIGNDPLSERLIPIFDDARTRFGTTDCRLVPNCITLHAIPLRASTMLQARGLRSWIYPQKLQQEAVLGDPAEVIRIDLSISRSESVDQVFDLTFSRRGEFEALMLCFTLNLDPTASLSTLPGSASHDNHWMSLLWRLPSPLPVEPGERKTVRYTYDKIEHSHFEII
jgi:predicted RNA methylase